MMIKVFFKKMYEGFINKDPQKNMVVNGEALEWIADFFLKIISYSLKLK